jgi:hypothetical protein
MLALIICSHLIFLVFNNCLLPVNICFHCCVVQVRFGFVFLFEHLLPLVPPLPKAFERLREKVGRYGHKLCCYRKNQRLVSCTSAFLYVVNQNTKFWFQSYRIDIIITVHFLLPLLVKSKRQEFFI